MTEHDFENFAALEPANRLESLKEIRMIVCGIVLFNKDTGIGNTMDQNIPDGETFFFLLQRLHSLFHSPEIAAEILRVDRISAAIYALRHNGSSQYRKQASDNCVRCQFLFALLNILSLVHGSDSSPPHLMAQLK